MKTLEQVVERDVTLALEQMMLIRAFEEQSASLQQAGKSPSMCTSVGQEASAVGVISALDARDQILTNHRSAGHLIARGADPRRVLAEIMGKSTGYCSGKSGSLHISVKELGVMLTSTIVGGELSLAPGVALSRQMLGGQGIVVVFFGDGAATEGIFHESINLASVWDLPILYVCENNQWQAFVHRRETMKVEHISEWSRAYRVKSQTVDGNDVDAVFNAAASAVDYVREQRRPFLLETYTYRLRGHMEPDDQSYVSPAELEAWKEHDPIATYTRRLLVDGVINQNELDEMRERVRIRIEEAATFALESPYPGLEELTTDVYA